MRPKICYLVKDFTMIKKALLYSLLCVNTWMLAQQSPALFPFRKGNTWGYSDSTKKVMIPLMYDATFPFSSGKAFVKTSKGKVLQIDSTGKTLRVLPYTSLYYSHHYGYLFTGAKNGNRGLITMSGEVLLPAVYDDVTPLGPDSFLVKRDGKEGIINSKQKVLQAFKAYDETGSPDFVTAGNGLCPKPCQYLPYSERMALVAHKGLFGFANEEQAIVIPCKYTLADSFYHGCAWVMYEPPGQDKDVKKIDGVFHAKSIILVEGFIDKYGTEYWED